MRVQTLDERHDRIRRLRVEVPGRFIGQDDRRIADERSSDRNPLCFTTGELGGDVIEARAEANSLEGHSRRSPPPPHGPTSIEQAIGHVIESRVTGQQMELLKDEANLASSQRRQLAIRQRGDVVSRHFDSPRRRPIECAHQMEQGRFAGAGRSDNRQQFTGPYVERHPINGPHRRGRGIDLHHVLKRQNRPTYVDAHGITTNAPTWSCSEVTSTRPSAKNPGSTATRAVEPSAKPTSTA